MKIQIECPSCQTAFEVDAVLLTQSLDKNGQRHLRCGACKETFVHTPVEPTLDLASAMAPEIIPEILPEPVVTPEPVPERAPETFPEFIAEPLAQPRQQPNPQKTEDFGAFSAKKPAKNDKKRSSFTSFLTFLILIAVIVLVGFWVAMTNPEWFQASYWLETRT